MNSDPKRQLSVAVCELTSVDDIDQNVEQILGLLNGLGARAKSLDLICLPENALYFRIREGEPLPKIELDHSCFDRLSKWSVDNGSPLHIGSVPLLEEGRLYNASVLVTPDGNRRATYRKTHLFDVDVEGQKPVRESDVFTHGAGPSLFELNGWKFGSSICYDIRFAELYSYYGKQQVDVILVPSAFLVTTGKAHWEILLRARAIENQCFVVAAAQGGTHQGRRGQSRSTYGHSLVVGPWGQVMVKADGVSGWQVLLAELDLSEIARARTQIPMQKHRRL